MAKFKLGQAVRVMRGKEQVFDGRIALVKDPGPTYYRVDSKGKDGMTYSITVEESWLEPDGDPKVSIDFTAQATCLIASLKSLAFSIGGTHVAGWVEEAERAAREGKVVKYE